MFSGAGAGSNGAILVRARFFLIFHLCTYLMDNPVAIINSTKPDSSIVKDTAIGIVSLDAVTIIGNCSVVVAPQVVFKSNSCV